MFTTLFLLSLLLVMVMNAALIWVATGPRSLMQAVPYVEKALSAPEKGYVVSIENCYLVWDGWQNPLDIRLKNVVVNSTTDPTVAKFPDVSLGVHFAPLFWGKLLPSSLILRSPELVIQRTVEGGTTLGVSSAESPEDVSSQQATIAGIMSVFNKPDSSDYLSELDVLRIDNARIRLRDQTGQIHFSEIRASAEIERLRGAVEAQTTVILPKKGAETTLRAHLLHRYGEDVYNGGLIIVNGDLADFAPFIPKPENFAGSEAIFNLQTNFSIKETGELVSNLFTLTIPAAKISTPYLDGTIALKDMELSGQTLGFKELEITSLEAYLNGAPLTMKGLIQNAEAGIGIKGELVAHNIPVDDVKLYWPPSLAPESREWVVNNVSGGKATELRANFNVMPGDLTANPSPEEMVRASIFFEGSQVKYKTEHPEVKNAQGVVRVNAKALQVDVSRGTYMTGTALTNAHMQIDDLNQDNPYIKVRLNAAAPIVDVISFLSLPDMGQAQNLKLDGKTAKGNAEGKIDLGFYFNAPRDAQGRIKEDEMVEFDVQGKLQNVSQPGVKGRFDVVNANGTIALNNKQVVFSGKAQVNGADATGELKYLFGQGAAENFFVKAKGRSTVASLPKFGLPDLSKWASGPGNCEVDYAQSDTTEKASAKCDLLDTQLMMPEYEWTKPEKKPATLSVTYQKTPSGTSLPSFDLNASGTRAVGAMGFDATESGIKNIRLDTFKMGLNDAQVYYGTDEPGYKIAIGGKYLDVSPWIKDSASNEFSFEKFPGLDLALSVDTLVLGKNRALASLQGKASCSKDFCSMADVKGKVGEDKPFVIQIGRDAGGKRGLNIRAEDAGAFLLAMDIYEKMQQGSLLVQGVYDDKAGSHTLKGKLTIRDFKVVNAPALAKLLTLASLTGILDTLSGSGISFDKLNTDFTLINDVITLKEGKARGSSIGITAEGTISFPGNKLDLEGTVVPAYAINTFAGNVPIVGDLLTGGDGGGIIAARYSMRGAAADPDVSVNPLSMLTPGFLRGIFDIFDAPAESKEPKEPKESKQPLE